MAETGYRQIEQQILPLKLQDLPSLHHFYVVDSLVKSQKLTRPNRTRQSPCRRNIGDKNFQ